MANSADISAAMSGAFPFVAWWMTSGPKEVIPIIHTEPSYLLDELHLQGYQTISPPHVVDLSSSTPDGDLER